MVNGTPAIESIAKFEVSRQIAGMTQLNDRSSLLAFLKTRKSASAKAMGGPGPDAAQLTDILSHGGSCARPWQTQPMALCGV